MRKRVFVSCNYSIAVKTQNKGQNRAVTINFNLCSIVIVVSF